MSDPREDFAFCQSELKRLDPVRHFTCLTASEDCRSDLIAFQAFLAELAIIPKRITEPAMGEIRLQWWQNVVTSAASSNPSDDAGGNLGPLAATLQLVQKRHALPNTVLQQIIDARVFDLYHDPMPDLESFETYAGETEALAMMMSAQVLAGKDTRLSDLCGHAAMAICLADHLFHWPDHAKRQRLFLPKTHLAQHNVDPKDLFNHPDSANVKAAILELSALAEEHHSKALMHFNRIPKGLRAKLAPAFLRLAPAKFMIEKRKKQPTGLLRLANWRAYWHIWRMAGSS